MGPYLVHIYARNTRLETNTDVEIEVFTTMKYVHLAQCKMSAFSTLFILEDY